MELDQLQKAWQEQKGSEEKLPPEKIMDVVRARVKRYDRIYRWPSLGVALVYALIPLLVGLFQPLPSWPVWSWSLPIAAFYFICFLVFTFSRSDESMNQYVRHGRVRIWMVRLQFAFWLLLILFQAITTWHGRQDLGSIIATQFFWSLVFAASVVFFWRFDRRSLAPLSRQLRDLSLGFKEKI